MASQSGTPSHERLERTSAGTGICYHPLAKDSGRFEFRFGLTAKDDRCSLPTT